MQPFLVFHMGHNAERNVHCSRNNKKSVKTSISKNGVANRHQRSYHKTAIRVRQWIVIDEI